MSHCEVQDRADFALILVEGEVDMSSSNDLRQAILGPLTAGRPVMVDLSRVRRIYSSGIAGFVEGYQQARSSGGAFGLVAPSQPVRRVLELARLDRVFPTYDNLEQAQASLS
jgi:anti-sigma B factor antagonist